jgi:hypothetical protein
MSASVPAKDSQAPEVRPAAEHFSSGSSQQLQEARQAVDVAKSRLADHQTTAQCNTMLEPPKSAQFNPKEISIDRMTSWRESPASADQTNEAGITSENDSGILYNGSAGLGSSSIIERDLDQPDMAAAKYEHNQTDLEFLKSKDPESKLS